MDTIRCALYKKAREWIIASNIRLNLTLNERMDIFIQLFEKKYLQTEEEVVAFLDNNMTLYCEIQRIVQKQESTDPVIIFHEYFKMMGFKVLVEDYKDLIIFIDADTLLKKF